MWPNPHGIRDCPGHVQGEDAESSDGDGGESTEVEGAADRLPHERMRRPRLRKQRSGMVAAEVAQNSLSAEQQHQLNQQAVADAFRCATTPEAGQIAQRSGVLYAQLVSAFYKRKNVCVCTWNRCFRALMLGPRVVAERADVCRYYLSPEAGGVGVASSGSALHELASDLAHRMSVRKQQDGPAVEAQESTQVRATTGRPAAACSPGACRPEGTVDGPQTGKLAHGVGTCNAQPEPVAGTDAEPRPCSDATPVSGHPSDTDDDSSIEGWSQESDDSEGSVEREEDPPKDAEGAVAEDDGVPGNGQSADGYFDVAASAKPRLSVFGVVWRLLGIWVCQATVLHLHKPDVQSTHCFPEHTRQVCITKFLLFANCLTPILLSSQEPHVVLSHVVLLQGQRALTNVLLKRVAPLLEMVSMPRTVRVALAEEQMHGLLATLDVRFAVPTMAPEVQDCLALVMVAAVSAHRMPEMSDALQPVAPHMAACLQMIGLTPELFTCLVECLVDAD